MGTGITCTVYADGERLADGCTGEPENVPTILSGLSITWGRDTTVDQPEASTCVFELLDPPGGGSFVDRLRTGTTIDVHATGRVYPDPTEPVWPDPGFETGLPGLRRANATTSRSARRVASGAYALRIDPVTAANRSTVTIAPAPFAAEGDDPAAWDGIVTTSAGQTWTYGASVFAPPGTVVLVRPVLYTGPWASAGTVVASDALQVVGDGTYQAVTATFQPNTDGSWVGLQVSSYPNGLTWDAVDPAVTWDTWTPADWQWDDAGAVFVDDIQVLAPAAGTESIVLVFSGRVVSLEASWDDRADAPVVKVECVDFTADLDNADVGDVPWTVEPMASRFQRILTASGMAVTADIDPSIAGILMSYRDVDSQPATGLLAELAESVDGVMWSATHIVTGPYLQVEDPTNRTSQFLLELVDGVVQIVPNPGQEGALELSACDLLRDDVAWAQDTQDVITRAAVTWQEQGVDDDGLPTTTERTVTLIDPELEEVYGVRRISLGTQLQAEADAQAIAVKLLARTSVSDWRASGLVIDDAELEDPDDVDTARVLTLLDGTARNGLALSLVDLPAWSPTGPVVPVYLEGGDYTFEDGAWVLDLTVSNATAQGASAAWDDLDPAWTWDQFDPGITWDDLRGVGVATEGA
jgi:hypothetical protein